MNTDRNHAQELACKYNARFLPVYIFISDEKVWEERVTSRYHVLKDQDVATWERIQHQRERFRAWELGTALFVDSIESYDANYRHVLDFVKSDNLELLPLPKVHLTEGRYHS